MRDCFTTSKALALASSAKAGPAVATYLRGTMLALLVGGMACCAPSTSHATLIDYNMTGDFTNNFIQNPSGTSRYVETNGIGISGTRALDVQLLPLSNDGDVITATYVGSSSDLSSPGGRLSFSQFVKTGNYVAAMNTLELAAIGASNQTLTDAAARYLSVSFNRFYSRLEVYNKTSTSPATLATYATGGAAATGRWYNLSVSLENVGPNDLSLSATLDDYGTTGTATPSRLITLSPTVFSNSDLASDSSVYAAFRGHAAGGADAYDNFAVQVPEPASAILAVFACLSAGMVLGRRMLCRNRNGTPDPD